ncbi:MAG: hypothetical protein RIC95_14875 [Vicingaceae bacterium]
MKYLFTTANKYFVTFLLTLLLSSLVQAQKTTHSPYSRYGIGLLNPQRTNANFAAGGIGYAWRPQNYKPQIYDSLARSNAKLNDRGTNYINLKNPASFSNISLTTFEAGIYGQGTEMVNGGQSRTESTAYLNHAALAFPIGENWGLGFGIRPYSKIGYDYQNSRTLASGETVRNQYQGSGGLNQIFLGTAVQFAKHWSLGVSGNYLFGTLNDERRVVYENGTNFFNTLDQGETRVSDFSFDFGLQYFANLNQDYRLVAGLTASPISELSGEYFRLVRNYAGNEDFEQFKDTTSNLEGEKVSLNVASTFGGGLSIEKRGDWMVGIDYALHNRKTERVSNNVELVSNSELNLGFEKFNNISAFGSYFKQMGYRAGMRYNSALLSVNGEAVQEFGISFGVSMPLRKSFSTLNFGAEIGRRGKDESGLTEESFFNLLFGITINDKWFVQRKYD